MLSDAKLRSLKPDARPYKLADGGGLYVLVTPTGSKLWRIAYRFGGKQKTLALGPYPTITLAEARERREAAKRELSSGRDPGQAPSADPNGITFKELAEEWFKRRERSWAPSYSDRLYSRMKHDLYPTLGPMSAAAIRPADILAVIRKIEARGAREIARRMLQTTGIILRYGVATLRVDRDVTADLRGAFERAPAVNGRAALSEKQLPDFLRALEAYRQDVRSRLTAQALMFTVLTMVRSQESRLAEWSEIESLDGPEPLWRIPAERMKMRRPHLVPLSRQAVAILKEARGASAGRYVFSTNGRPLSVNTMIFAMYRMGYHSRATVHGFRKTASTILNEQGWNSDWIERQLAHTEGSVRSIYNSAEYLPGRREMLQWWADRLVSA
jgi:integrase